MVEEVKVKLPCPNLFRFRVGSSRRRPDLFAAAVLAEVWPAETKACLGREHERSS